MKRADDDMRTGMTVEEVARHAGLPANTVRYYARQTLVSPRRHPDNGYRLFTDSDIARLRFIRRAQQLGLKLEQIRAVLATVDRGGSPCPLVRKLVSGRIRETAEQIAELTELRERMQRALERWADLPDCPSSSSVICHLVEGSV